MGLSVTFRSLEQPIIHRYKEIEEFPKALNVSQMMNWSARLFITEAKTNLTLAQETDIPPRITKEEIDSLERTLKDHERWMNEEVEKQKKVKMNGGPVLETKTLREKVKPLESQLQELMKKKAPRILKKSKTVGSTSSWSTASESTASSGSGRDEL